MKGKNYLEGYLHTVSLSNVMYLFKMLVRKFRIIKETREENIVFAPPHITDQFFVFHTSTDFTANQFNYRILNTSDTIIQVSKIDPHEKQVVKIGDTKGNLDNENSQAQNEYWRFTESAKSI